VRPGQLTAFAQAMAHRPAHGASREHAMHGTLRAGSSDATRGTGSHN
jgi:hypothetical protein